MHSPIFYALKTENPDNLPTIENLKENLPEEDVLYDSVPECDWGVIDTTSDTRWHRGQWEGIKEMFEDNTLCDVEVHNDDWLKVSIPKENIMKAQRERIDTKRAYLDVLEKGLDNDILVNTFVSKGKLFTKDEADATLKHYDMFESYGGLLIGMLYESDGFQPYVFNTFIKESDLLSEAVLSSNIGETLEFYISTRIQGDYHF